MQRNSSCFCLSCNHDMPYQYYLSREEYESPKCFYCGKKMKLTLDELKEILLFIINYDKDYKDPGFNFDIDEDVTYPLIYLGIGLSMLFIGYKMIHKFGSTTSSLLKYVTNSIVKYK